MKNRGKGTYPGGIMSPPSMDNSKKTVSIPPVARELPKEAVDEDDMPSGPSRKIFKGNGGIMGGRLRKAKSTQWQ